MITVPEAADKIIDRSRYLSEAISKGLINLSALARYMKPELEEMLNKKVSNAAIFMALNRLAATIKPKYIFKNIFKSPPDMLVRSNLLGITIAHSEKLGEKHPSLLRLSNTNDKYFFTITQGVFDTTIIASKDLAKTIKLTLQDETIVAEYNNLASITIKLPKEAVATPGIFYFFLKSLAWEGVNIVEIVSSYLEFTLILPEKETNRAFSILQSLFVLSV
ncbi:MAG: aspartate kinase [Candidatus Levybacteria bacterium]|nr:aspartate kinase [Candidatus Levybacteria bacterium]